MSGGRMHGIICVLLAGIVLTACGGEPAATPAGQSPVIAASGPPQVGPDGHYPSVQIADDGTKHLIPLDEVQAGGPPKDGIPSIDSPHFSGPDGWDALNYHGNGLVIGVEVNGKRRAYPFQILVWHEIANDVFDGQPLLITYCPLCGTGIVFVPAVAGEHVEFGVSGKLYKSDLLMYDRASDSLWSQITGTAVVGEQAGTRLALYPSEMMTWDEWRATYPDSDVLTRLTGHKRDYDATPYRGYDTNDEVWFPVGDRDDRLHPKTRVTGVELDRTTFGAWPDEQVIADGPVNDTLGDRPLLIVADLTAGNTIRVFERRLDGRTLSFRRAPDDDALIDDETGSHWNVAGLAIGGELTGSQLSEHVPVRGFWFAWFAFHPDTHLWLSD
ncbi:MAG: DUF3179 domain-containing protein [Acidobacteriota bacterium]|nr:DUF3179 domain-containing protein [Acidobacteriota bacterium]MDQ3547299.1 DUF3179 domain-containing protein [Chloroflexota bacterium]